MYCQNSSAQFYTFTLTLQQNCFQFTWTTWLCSCVFRNLMLRENWRKQGLLLKVNRGTVSPRGPGPEFVISTDSSNSFGCLRPARVSLLPLATTHWNINEDRCAPNHTGKSGSQPFWKCSLTLLLCHYKASIRPCRVIIASEAEQICCY